MLRHQQDRDSLPRFIETMDTSEHGPAIGNKTGALNQVRNDVALIRAATAPSSLPPSPLTTPTSDGAPTTKANTLAKLARRSSSVGRPRVSIRNRFPGITRWLGGCRQAIERS